MAEPQIPIRSTLYALNPAYVFGVGLVIVVLIKLLFLGE